MPFVIDSSAALARALDQPLDPDLKRLLALRRDQVGDISDVVRFVVVTADDTLASVEVALGLPLLLTDEASFWEWDERHDGGWLELCFTTVEDGPADVLLVREGEDTDPDLIDLLHRHIAPDLERQSAKTP